MERSGGGTFGYEGDTDSGGGNNEEERLSLMHEAESRSCTIVL